MLKRTLTSIVSICILLPILFFSDTVVLPLAVAIFCTIALNEMYRCIGKSKKLAYCIPAYAVSIILPMILRYIPAVYIEVSFICACTFLLYLFVLCIFSKGKTSFGEIGEFFSVTLYIIAAFNAILYIRDMPRGEYLYLLIFIGAWVTDIFAYFSGVLFGKHKLIPEVSPKKTVEGSIGGTLFCIGAFVLFGFVTNFWITKSNEWVYVNYAFLAIGGMLAAIVSQVGDLIMSVVKRRYGVKDYGKLFPGHGGVLDRFDSILAVSLTLCVICIFSQLTGITLIGGGIE